MSKRSLSPVAAGLLVLCVGIVGCKKTKDKPRGELVDGVCQYPLSCKNWSFKSGTESCPSFAEAVKKLESIATETFVDKAEVGTCGEFKYTYWGNLHEKDTAFFDSKGSLVARLKQTDMIAACGDGKTASNAHGRVPKCKRASTRVIKKPAE